MNDMYWIEKELGNAVDLFGVKAEAVDALSSKYKY